MCAQLCKACAVDRCLVCFCCSDCFVSKDEHQANPLTSNILTQLRDQVRSAMQLEHVILNSIKRRDTTEPRRPHKHKHAYTHIFMYVYECCTTTRRGGSLTQPAGQRPSLRSSHDWVIKLYTTKDANHRSALNQIFY